MIRGRRAVRWLILGVLLGAGLTATADIVALTVLESRGSSQIAAGLAAERATLDLGGWPLLPGFISGRLDNVSAEVVGSSATGLRVERVTIEFRTAHFEPRPVYAVMKSRYATRTAVRGEDVFARVEITEGDLAEFLRSRDGRVAAVQINSGGVNVTFHLDDGELSPPARYFPAVVERRIALRLLGASGLPGDLRELVLAVQGIVDLPKVPEGLRTLPAKLRSGAFELEFAGPAVELTVGEGAGQALAGIWPWSEEGDA